MASAIVFSALALGAIHTTVLWITALVVGASAACAWFFAPVARPRAAANLLLTTCVGLTAFTAFQLVPLPMGVLRVLAPNNADVWSRALTPLHLPGPSFAPISLDPVATGVEVLRGMLYLAAFLAVVRISSRREGTFFCSAVLVVSATVVGIAGLLHPAMGAERVFGLYRPTTYIEARHIAPILNVNALAAYVNIGFFIVLAEGITSRPTVPRPIAWALAGVLMAIQFWLASRGAVITMLIGSGMVGWMTRVSTRVHRHPGLGRLASAMAIVVVVAGVAMWVFASSDEAWKELADTDVSKVRIFEQVTRMIRHYPLWGAGRGSFESTFPVFREGTGHIVYTHPENVLLQWASEWGLPVALAGFGAVAWALHPSILFSRSRPSVGAWVALIATLLHNQVDLNSEFPAVMLALCVCAGMIVGGTGVGTFRRSDIWAKRPRLIAFGAPVGVLAAIALVLPNADRDLYSDRMAMRQAALAPMPREAFHELARATMSRHPAEPYLPFTGAIRAIGTKDDSVLPWAGRTLELAPVYGPAHWILARSLFRRSSSQARLEYRLAVEQAPGFFAQIAAESAPLVTGPNEAMELVPEGGAGLSMLESLADRLADSHPSTQLVLDDEILRRRPDSAPAIARRARAQAADVVDEAVTPWCSGTRRSQCVEQAIATAQRLQQLRPSMCEGYALEAEVRAAAGDVDRALGQLESRADRVDDAATCFEGIVQIAKRTGRYASISSVVDKLARAGCSDDLHCVAQLFRAAAIEDDRGNPLRALSFLRRARDRYPNRDDVLAARAVAAAKLGLHAEALDEYVELAKRHPENTQWPARITEERQALVQLSAPRPPPPPP
ncbi:O-antigen ligase family protein [Pendulispora albinea]|uniref:O-antigen ligase family protein n=1 Tax=Pendulispora albinea TaxID=2741071 RepID=A0ABZ2LPK9_9BACT